MSKFVLEKVAMNAVRWPVLETNCKGLNKIIKNMNKLCKIIVNDLERVGMENSIFEKMKIYFYRNELVIYKNNNLFVFK